MPKVLVYNKCKVPKGFIRSSALLNLLLSSDSLWGKICNNNIVNLSCKTILTYSYLQYINNVTGSNDKINGVL